MGRFPSELHDYWKEGGLDPCPNVNSPFYEEPDEDEELDEDAIKQKGSKYALYRTSRKINDGD